MPRKDDGMWTVVSFDLPVRTAEQRRDATQFRERLCDLGFGMDQYAIYVKYYPTGHSAVPDRQMVVAGLPPEGHIRVLHVPDRQWVASLRFSNSTLAEPVVAPTTLRLF